MSEYIQRIAHSAIRFTGQPCAISPQLEDYGRIPNIRRPMDGKATDYRLILYVGYIETSDVTITFPEEHLMKVEIKHDMKAIDPLSHRLSKKPGRKVPALVRASHCPIICTREDSSYYCLPSNVKKSSLTAHMTQDGFLVVQSRMICAETVPEFDVKRLVVMKVSRDINISHSDVDCVEQAASMVEQAAILATEVLEMLADPDDDKEELERMEGEENREGEMRSGVISLEDWSRKVLGDSRISHPATGESGSSSRRLFPDTAERLRFGEAKTMVRDEKRKGRDSGEKDVPRVQSTIEREGGGPSSEDSMKDGLLRSRAPESQTLDESSYPKKKTSENISFKTGSSEKGSQISIEKEPSPERFCEIKGSSLEKSKIGKEQVVKEVVETEEPVDEAVEAGIQVVEAEGPVDEAIEAEEQIVEKDEVEKPAVEEVEEVGEPAVKEVEEAEEPTIEEVEEAKEPAVEEVEEAEEPTVKEVEEAEEPIVEKVEEAEEPAVKEVEEAKEPAVEEVEEAEEPVVEEVDEAKQPVVKEVDEAKKLILKEATEDVELVLEEVIETEELVEDVKYEEPDVKSKESSVVVESEEKHVEEKVIKIEENVEEKTRVSKETAPKEKTGESKKPKLQKKASSKRSVEKSIPQKGVEGKKSSSNEPENGTKKGQSDSSEDSSPVKDEEGKEQSPPENEPTTARRSSKTEQEVGDSKVPPPDGKEKKVATKALPARTTRAAALSGPSKPPASPLKQSRSKLKSSEDTPATPSKRGGKAKPKDSEGSKRA